MIKCKRADLEYSCHVHVKVHGLYRIHEYIYIYMWKAEISSHLSCVDAGVKILSKNAVYDSLSLLSYLELWS